MFTIKEITCPEEKYSICGSVLRALPSWFGIESSIQDYENGCKSMPFFAAFNHNNRITGFICLKEHNEFTSEVYVMGIYPDYHRHGIGTQLVDTCILHCKDNDKEFLTVKTLDESGKSESYDKTRKFYHAMGFRPLEMFPDLWSKENPCLLMAKYLN